MSLYATDEEKHGNNLISEALYNFKLKIL